MHRWESADSAELRRFRHKTRIGLAEALALLACLACQAKSKMANPADRQEPSRAPDQSMAKVAALQEETAFQPIARSALQQMRFVGRVQKSESSARYAWSGAGFVARFVGTGASVHMDDHGSMHTVLVDGREREPVVTRAGKRVYRVVENLSQGEHLLEFYRRNEPSLGTTTLFGLTIDQGKVVSPPAKKPLLLEVVGDSITCGYGNLGDSPECPFSPETENHYLSYGAVAARLLGAEVSTVAWSGRGVVKNYGGEEGAHIPEMYDRVLPRDPESLWTFSSPADAIIVNLGTNDFSTEPDPPVDRFAAAYERLLWVMRERNPQAVILATIGPMLSGEALGRARRAIALAVQARKQAGDSRVFEYQLQAKNSDPGCHFHPGIETHRAMGIELARELERKLSPRRTTRATFQ